ncbi:MAG: Flp family type IVb pilin [Vicinamibacterales bacterium]
MRLVRFDSGARFPRRGLILRFVCDDAGQDVIEYGLLSSGIALVGVLLWQTIGTGIFNAYTGWDTGVQGLSACTPDPGGGGCP